MPQGTLSSRAQAIWDRVTRRQNRQQPQRFADVAAAQRRSQNRADNRLTFGSSLPNLQYYPNIEPSQDWRPANSENPLGIYHHTSSSSPPPHTPSPPASVVLQSRFSVSDSPDTMIRDREDGNGLVIALARSFHESDDEDGDRPQPWTLPGTDMFPTGQARQLDARFFTSPRQRYRVRANGKNFMIPIDVFVDVFAFLLEIFASPSGFIGTENGINLRLILSALILALDQGMVNEIKKLEDTINRYIALRIFHHNPHTEPFSLGQAYFKYHSEEIYRSWVIVSMDERLQSYLRPGDLTGLYVYTVDHIWWGALTARFDWRFRNEIEDHYRRIGRNPARGFRGVAKGFFGRTGLGIHPWMEKPEESAASGKEKGKRAEKQEETEEAVQSLDDNVSVLSLGSAVLRLPAPLNESPTILDDHSRRRRRIHREAAILPPAGRSIDMIEPLI
ncbi:hypothetical protein F66182_7927 [Fusarium sp. NRRL 66182]|nr:hypothetical protein F66182_7927 [Fusarium sp. NRRL 66182]